MKLRVYIAGPYSKGDPQANVDNAIDAAERVAALGHVPFIPHLTHYWELRHRHAYQFWLDQDLEWLQLCDAVLRLEGESRGADGEVRFALANGLMVYTALDQIPKAWADAT